MLKTVRTHRVPVQLGNECSVKSNTSVQSMDEAGGGRSCFGTAKQAADTNLNSRREPTGRKRYCKARGDLKFSKKTSITALLQFLKDRGNKTVHCQPNERRPLTQVRTEIGISLETPEGRAH